MKFPRWTALKRPKRDDAADRGEVLVEWCRLPNTRTNQATAINILTDLMHFSDKTQRGMHAHGKVNFLKALQKAQQRYEKERNERE